MLQQIRRNPSKQSAIQSAFKQIKKDIYSLQDLYKLTKLDWKDIEVLSGLGKKLAAEVKIWDKERQNQDFRNILDNLAHVALDNSSLQDFNIES